MAIAAYYKGELLTIADSDETKTLVTQDTYLEDDVRIESTNKHSRVYIAESPTDEPPSFAQVGDIFITFK